MATATATATRTGREYLRVSFDHSENERSNDDQHADNVDAAEEFGIVLGKAYRDVGSASRFAKLERDDFANLMADLRSGAFGADVLQMWEGSRGSRQPQEWLDLISACQAQSVQIFITTHRRFYDLNQWRDRHALIEEALKAAASSEETSERVTRTLSRNAEKGRPHGICPYGYMRTYTKVRNTKGRLVRRPEKQLPDPAEALNVIELFVKLRARESFNAIVADWAERGIVSRDGVPFSQQSLSQMARKVSYVGKRVYKLRGESTEFDAEWPVVADFEGSPMSADDFVTLFHEVQRILSEPQRLKNPGGGVKHIWTMTLRCDVCSGPVTVTAHLSRTGGQVYACRDKGCVRLSQKAALDDFLRRTVLAYLARPDVYAHLGHDGDDPALDPLRVELSRKRSALQETREAEPESLAEERRLARREERLTAEVRALEEQERNLTAPSPVADLFPQGPADTVAARWDALPIHRQRAIAGLLLSPAVLGQVRIMRVADSETESVADRCKWVRGEHDE
ncbi:recombinase family protein [Streptomyces sp. NPDC047009]|uniref:recombinase family protein n=1 Tax=Streptomyces sp. NPDC047009 TaxID=3154496 RepID=UPI0033E09FC2